MGVKTDSNFKSSEKWNKFLLSLATQASLPQTSKTRLAFITSDNQRFVINNFDELKSIAEKYGTIENNYYKLEVNLEVLGYTFEEFKQRNQAEFKEYQNNNNNNNNNNLKIPFELSSIQTTKATIRRAIHKQENGKKDLNLMNELNKKNNDNDEKQNEKHIKDDTKNNNANNSSVLYDDVLDMNAIKMGNNDNNNNNIDHVESDKSKLKNHNINVDDKKNENIQKNQEKEEEEKVKENKLDENKKIENEEKLNNKKQHLLIDILNEPNQNNSQATVVQENQQKKQSVMNNDDATLVYDQKDGSMSMEEERHNYYLSHNKWPNYVPNFIQNKNNEIKDTQLLDLHLEKNAFNPSQNGTKLIIDDSIIQQQSTQSSQKFQNNNPSDVNNNENNSKNEIPSVLQTVDNIGELVHHSVSNINSSFVSSLNPIKENEISDTESTSSQSLSCSQSNENDKKPNHQDKQSIKYKQLKKKLKKLKKEKKLQLKKEKKMKKKKEKEIEIENEHENENEENDMPSIFSTNNGKKSNSKTMTENITKLNDCIDRFSNIVNSFSQSAMMMNQSIAQFSQISNSLYFSSQLNNNQNPNSFNLISSNANFNGQPQLQGQILQPQQQLLSTNQTTTNLRPQNNNVNVSHINSSPFQWVQVNNAPKSLNNGSQQTSQQIHSDAMNPLSITTSQQPQSRGSVIQDSPILHSMSPIRRQIEDPSITINQNHIPTPEKEGNDDNNHNKNSNNHNKEISSSISRSMLGSSSKKNITPEMEDKLNKLKEMGYDNSNFCLILLQQHKGDLNKVIEEIKQFYSNK